MKILVVDDDRGHAIQTRRLLEMQGHEASIAESGKEALQRLRTKGFSTAIVAWQMPDFDGLELVRQLRTNGASEIPYIILVTNAESMDDVRAGFECGVDDYLTTPIEAIDLYARLTVAERMIGARAAAGMEQGELARVRADLERLTYIHIRTSEDVGRFCRDLEYANAQLKALSITDSLTGLKNKREFHERLDDEVSRAKRYVLPLSLMMLDVDHFKRFNDCYGHPAGDEVLKRVAIVLESHARETDILARYGGEEFAVILANTDHEQALHAAERLRAAVAEEDFPPCRVTVSIGVSTLALAAKSASDLIVEADTALYASKNRGRNCVSHYVVPEAIDPD